MRRFLSLLGLSFITVNIFASTSASFSHVKIHRHKNAQERVLVDKAGTLSFNDAAHRLIFKSNRKDSFDVPYASITKVVFDSDGHMREDMASRVIPGLKTQDHWFYFEYPNQGVIKPVLLKLPADSSEQIIDKVTAVLGSRVISTDFPEKGEHIDKETLPDLQSKQEIRVNTQYHPLPEARLTEATIVVVCPPLAARYAGRGIEFRLHANDHVIAVNKAGTYSMAYLAPGSYRLVSQSENANGFEMKLEAGKIYYFIQNTYQGVLKPETVLSRNSPELVTYEVNGSEFSNWTPK